MVFFFPSLIVDQLLYKSTPTQFKTTFFCFPCSYGSTWLGVTSHGACSPPVTSSPTDSDLVPTAGREAAILDLKGKPRLAKTQSQVSKKLGLHPTQSPSEFSITCPQAVKAETSRLRFNHTYSQMFDPEAISSICNTARCVIKSLAISNF